MKHISANVTVKIAGQAFQIKVSVPDKKTKQDVVLPLFRELTQKAEDLAIAKLADDGKKISCHKGCGACCCQIVPVTPLEARYLARLMESMPKARRQKYKIRFDDAYKKFQQAGILDQLLNPENFSGDIIAFGIKYFQLGVPCPFLEHASCSIYTERPLRCREYLVTNAPEYCSNPSNETIDRVEYPVHMSKILTKVHKRWAKDKTQWVPLAVLPSWVQQHPQDTVLRNSKEWIDDALTALSE